MAKSKISLTYVVLQIVTWSVAAWALTFLLTLLAMSGGRSFASALRLMSLLVGLLVLMFGVFGIASGPVMGFNRMAHLAYRPARRRTSVGDTSPDGLTGLGVALFVTPQLLFVGLVVLGQPR